MLNNVSPALINQSYVDWIHTHMWVPTCVMEDEEKHPISASDSSSSDDGGGSSPQQNNSGNCNLSE